jgi:hypothetical protein
MVELEEVVEEMSRSWEKLEEKTGKMMSGINFRVG